MKTLVQFLYGMIWMCTFPQDTANFIPYRGQSTDQSGQLFLTTGPSNVVLRLYRQTVGGIAIWEESQPNVSVNAGRFSVLIGSRTELPVVPNFDSTRSNGLSADSGASDVKPRLLEKSITTCD